MVNMMRLAPALKAAVLGRMGVCCIILLSQFLRNRRELLQRCLKVIGNFLCQDIRGRYPPLWEWGNRGSFETQSSQRARREGEGKREETRKRKEEAERREWDRRGREWDREREGVG
jgi:hypothetical protein